MKKVYAFEKNCLGCGLCEVYCRTAHSKSKDIIKTYKKENVDSAITIEEIEKNGVKTFFALQCRHCVEPKCVQACISGAMYKDENGIVRNIKEKCVGCQSCIMACPFGAIKMSVSGTVISKCDLCTENGDEPACAKNCPNGALKFMDLEEDKKIR